MRQRYDRLPVADPHCFADLNAFSVDQALGYDERPLTEYQPLRIYDGTAGIDEGRIPS